MAGAVEAPVTERIGGEGIQQLEELLGELEEGSPARETVAREAAHLREHQPRMDYPSAQRRKEPLGRGVGEATCA